MKMNKLFTKTVLAAFLAIVLSCSFTYGQVVVNEGFELNAGTSTYPNTNLPLGWSQIKISASVDPNNYWDRMNNTATLQTCSPRSGSVMMRFRSNTALNGSQAGLVSRRFDMRNIPAGGATVSFWMYRDNGSTSNLDNIQIAYNNAPNLTGAIFLNAPSAAVINRPCTQTPIWAGCAASYNASNWQQYTYTIPQNVTSVSSSLYIILVGTSAAGLNIYIDDFSIQTYPNNQVLAGIPNAYTINFQNTANVGFNTQNNMIIGIKITTDGEGNPLFCDSLSFNTNGCTAPVGDLVPNSAKLWFTGGTPQFSLLGSTQFGSGQPVNATNYVFSPTTYLGTTCSVTFPGSTIILPAPIGALALGMCVKAPGVAPGAIITGIAGTTITLSLPNTASAPAGSTVRFTDFFLQQGDNYFWITYDIQGCPTCGPAGTATAGDCLDAEFAGFKFGALTGTFSATNILTSTLPGCREIDIVYCGGSTPFYSVGTSWLNGSYTNNDYVRSTFLNGVPTYPVIASSEPNNNYGPPCCSSGPINPPVYKSYFSNHPPDYELFSPDSPGRTTTLRIALATSVTTVSGNTTITVPGGTTNIAVGDYLRIPGFGSPYDWSTCSAPPVVTAVLSGTTVQVFPAPLFSTTTTGYFGGYKIDIQCGTWSGSNYVAAWIDFDKAAGFTNTNWTGGGEKISQSPSLTSLSIHTCYFQVPSTAVIGKNTLRVREVYATSNIDPCASATYGETEDYSINIIGFCGIAGWKTWLGFTDDWNTASNWCPAGVPTGVQNVRIPGTGAVGYTRPIIKAGVSAFCNKLRIEGADTLYIDAYQNGGLTANDSIYIQAPQGMIKVISSYSATAVMGIGTLYNANATPLKGGQRYHKMQITYTQAELLAKGLVAGDVITQIVIPVTSYGSVGATVCHTFNGLNVNYYYTNPFFAFAAGTPTLAPQVPLGSIANVYSGNPAIVVGDNPLVLTTPITWNGSANNLIIEICYALPTPGTACIGATSYSSERVDQSPTLGVNSTAYWGDLTLTTPGCALTGTGSPRGSYQQRPNLKFVFNRPYSKVPIQLAGHWGNNGTFVPGFSKVTFSSVNPQNIAGTSNTNFYDLVINNSHASGVLQVKAATLIGDTLNLVNGPFRLGSETFTHNNNLPTSVIRTNGWLQSETSASPYGRFLWKMGANTSPHIFPFGTASGAANYMPFTFTPTAGAGIEVNMATYTTVPANTPFPSGVPAIQNFYTGADNSANMVDRFWQIDLAGTGTTGNYLFTYRNAEIAANGNTNPRAQRWQTATSKWTDPSTFASQTNPTANQVQVTGVTQSGPWAISIAAQPLPVELLSFSAKKEKDRVKLLWSTASETNNDYFTIERTQNQNEFSFIDKVDSRGPSSNILEYYTYDYRPLNGLQYYRLMQTDFDGTSTYSKLVPVTFGKENFEIITVSSSNDESRNVLFNYDTDGQVSIKVVDIMGKTVYEKLNFKTIDGINQFDLGVANLTSGVFTIFIFDDTRKVSRKIIF